MGWQDRDYARSTPPPGPGRHGARPVFASGKSVVTALIIINVAVFALVAFFPKVEPIIYGLAALRADAVMHGYLWQLITAQYLHAGVGHLLINMLVLHFLGRPLERMWSARKFFTIYTLCGLAGNVFYVILAARGVIDVRTPAVGASGCIYGLLGIVAVLFPTATVWVYFLFPIRIRTAAFIFGGLAVLSIVTRRENFGGEACHLAGLVFGVWWAMKGDAWWARTEWRVPRWRSRLRRMKPETFTARVAERRADAETIDRILRKVYEGGIHSLSEAEKQALQDATERQRQREREAGRVNRV